MQYSTMTTTVERPPATLNGADWRNSTAKQLVAQDVIDGLIPLEGDIDVLAIFNDLYADHSFFANFPFDETRYKSRFESIRKAVKRLQQWAQYDSEKITEDLTLHPPPATNIKGELRWKGSEAESFLKEDMEQGIHLQLKPSEFRQTREAYKLFGLKVFRKHIDQAKQSKKEFDKVTTSKRYARMNLGDKALSRGKSDATSSAAAAGD